MRIDHVQVAAPPGCEEDARRFYGGVLGLKEVEKPEALRERGGVWFEQLHVSVEKDDAVPGVRRFYASDPFGNRLEFLQRP
jgi:catechol 2,3-dioxygenase-like lactoylglutathione lyase family enzyme